MVSALYNTSYPPHLPQQDSPGNESFTNAHSFHPYLLILYLTVPETEGWLLSPFETWDNPAHTKELEIGQKTKTYLNGSSIYNLCDSSPSSVLKLSSLELQRMLESFQDQVDWLEGAVKMAKHPAPLVYCKVMEDIVLAQIYQFPKTEGEGDKGK